MCRFGAAELHSVAAIVGGMAAQVGSPCRRRAQRLRGPMSSARSRHLGEQEAVKVVTRQFVPFSGTFIYNGIDGTSATIDI